MPRPLSSTPAAAVGQQRDDDARAVAGHRLVDGVVDDLPDEVVEAGQAGGADVHARALAHRVEPLEDLDVLGAVRPVAGRAWRSGGGVVSRHGRLVRWSCARCGPFGSRGRPVVADGRPPAHRLGTRQGSSGPAATCQRWASVYQGGVTAWRKHRRPRSGRRRQAGVDAGRISGARILRRAGAGSPRGPRGARRSTPVTSAAGGGCRTRGTGPASPTPARRPRRAARRCSRRTGRTWAAIAGPTASSQRPNTPPTSPAPGPAAQRPQQAVEGVGRPAPGRRRVAHGVDPCSTATLVADDGAGRDAEDALGPRRRRARPTPS